MAESFLRLPRRETGVRPDEEGLTQPGFTGAPRPGGGSGAERPTGGNWGYGGVETPRRTRGPASVVLPESPRDAPDPSSLVHSLQGIT